MTTNAERQASYRRRHANAGGGRINHAVSAHAEAGRRRLAKHYGATQRAMLERFTVRPKASLSMRSRMRTGQAIARATRRNMGKPSNARKILGKSVCYKCP